MKRHPRLQTLSREHHGALKLARAARHAAESGNAGNVAALAQRIGHLFATELDPHFRVEEQGILVSLARAGEHALVQRTLNDHEELRKLVGTLASADAGALRRFADLLASHVRFEERELFEAAQDTMAAT